MKILTHPHPLLRKKAQEIIQVDEKIQGLVLAMQKTMKENKGLGLAANQIGELVRLIVVNTSDGPIGLVNPKINKKSFFKELGEEGCLSLPNVFGEVKRYKKIEVKALDLKGGKIKFIAGGLFARVIQHEVDHLDGVLLIDRITKKA